MDKEIIEKQLERYIRSCSEYTSDYERKKITGHWLSKEMSARGLLADFIRRAGQIREKRILEIGFGNGVQSITFSKGGAIVSGLEVNAVLFDIAKENALREGVEVKFGLYDGKNMPFADSTFDYIFATSVFEHADDVNFLLEEASRILKPGGRFYISYPNRWAPRETHTGFWFVHFLPIYFAEPIIKLLGSNAIKELNLRFLSFFTLKQLIKDKNFLIVPELNSSSLLKEIFKRIMWKFGIHHSALLKTVMVVLERYE